MYLEFQHEVRVSGSLKHPHLVRLLGVVTSPVFGTVMEYMEEGDLYRFVGMGSKSSFSFLFIFFLVTFYSLKTVTCLTMGNLLGVCVFDWPWMLQRYFFIDILFFREFSHFLFLLPPPGHEIPPLSQINAPRLKITQHPPHPTIFW